MFLAVSRCFSSLMHVQTNASAAPAFLRVEKLSLLPRCSFHALLTRRRRSLLSSPMPQAHGHPFARPITDELLVERAASQTTLHPPSSTPHRTTRGPHTHGTPSLAGQFSYHSYACQCSFNSSLALIQHRPVLQCRSSHQKIELSRSLRRTVRYHVSPVTHHPHHEERLN